MEQKNPCNGPKYTANMLVEEKNRRACYREQPSFESIFYKGGTKHLFLDNSIVGGGGIWSLNVSIGNTKRYQLSHKALGPRHYYLIME